MLTHHPIPKELVQSIYENWYRFFLSEQKHDFLFNRETQDGYFPPSVSEVAKGHSQKDIKEYFHIYPWGQMPAELKAQAMEYYRLANDLAAELLGWVEQYPGEIAAHYSCPLSSMIEEPEDPAAGAALPALRWHRGAGGHPRRRPRGHQPADHTARRQRAGPAGEGLGLGMDGRALRLRHPDHQHR